ncbi:hypothetical protein GCK32_003249 [Trichostrongylus colubriformis]|uniref:G-protein coupled receptors family 1 profile domain-containing protein n=1 Tax=Trichostrongylus colubriformis TaxID=6319 RepID=A0AAN8IUL5_TRICO
MHSSVLHSVSSYYVVSTILVFNVVGVFGNLQLLWTTYRKNFAHSKSGMLLAMNAFYHTVCLLSELVNAAYLILDQWPTRRTCYNFMMAYIFALNQQAIMMTMISVDLLLALIFPIWYRLYSTKRYLIIIFVVCTTFALPISVLAWIDQDDEVVPFCIPPAALPPAILPFAFLSVTVLSFATLAVYAVIMVLLRVKSRCSTNFDTKKMVRRLQVIILIYLCSWFASSSLANSLHLFVCSVEDLITWQSNLVLFNLVTYSQTFYHTSHCYYESFKNYHTHLRLPLVRTIYWREILCFGQRASEFCDASLPWISNQLPSPSPFENQHGFSREEKKRSTLNS